MLEVFVDHTNMVPADKDETLVPEMDFIICDINSSSRKQGNKLVEEVQGSCCILSFT